MITASGPKCIRVHVDSEKKIRSNYARAEKAVDSADWASVSLPPVVAGWSSLVARQAHNLKVAGSNPAPAPNL